MQIAFATRVLLLILASLSLAKVGIAKGDRFSQLSLILSSPRQYEWDFDRKHNAIVLFIKKTSASELTNLDNYDESTIKRIVVRDLGGQGSEVKFYLRDRNLRSTLAHFYEPFRINIDVYDASYKESIDPQTGMPFVPMAEKRNESDKGAVADQSEMIYRGEEETQLEAPVLVPKTTHQLVRPEGFHSSDANLEITDIKSGLGEEWSKYPIYVYRLHTILHLADETQQQWLQKNTQNAEASPEAMAEFAGKLYDFGHEAKALEGYRQVLKEKPSVFQKAPLHLWRMAEANLGTGHTSLADGYYAQFISLFPQSKLHPLAQLRRLDIAAINAVKAQNTAELNSLSEQLNQLPGDADAEFQGLKAIRSAYWSQPPTNFSEKNIPEVTAKEYQPLQSSLAGLESFKTQFLARTLLLYNMTHSDHPWKNSTGEFAGEYFNKYKDYGNDDYVAIVKDRLRRKLENTLAKYSSEQKFDQVVSTFESLPKSLQSIRKTPLVSWYIAEAYRKLGQTDNAIPFYSTTAEGADNITNKFKASVWQALLASRLRRSSAEGKRRELDKQISEADKRLEAIWAELDSESRNKQVSAMQEPLQSCVLEENNLRSPLKIMLDSWEATMSPEKSPMASANNKENRSGAIKTLSVMAGKFKAMGQEKERQRSINLIKMFRPSQLQGDSESKNLWTQEILSLAEEMRLENNLLEAGQLYVLAGSESENFQNRAETLYKGGLLLYRSGRRKEAVEALQKASEDGDNQFYANLAKERLNRLSN